MSQEDTMEETGWKLVHGDVFRPPRRAWLLTAFVGSGVQIFFMVLITLGKNSRDKPNAWHVKCISETSFIVTLRFINLRFIRIQEVACAIIGDDALSRCKNTQNEQGALGSKLHFFKLIAQKLKNLLAVPFNSVCHAWDVVTCKPRKSDDSNYISLCLHGVSVFQTINDA